MRVYVYMYIYIVYICLLRIRLSFTFSFFLCSSAQFPQKLVKLFCQSYKNLHFCNPCLPNGAQIKTKRNFFLLHIIG